MIASASLIGIGVRARIGTVVSGFLFGFMGIQRVFVSAFQFGSGGASGRRPSRTQAIRGIIPFLCCQ